MIYCVVPQEMAGELYEQLATHYAEDPNVTVIVDRRKGDRRARGSRGTGHQRTIRDRRRARVPGEFPAVTAG